MNLTIRADRDPSRFNLDEKTAERRRGLFWEMFSTDVLYVRAFIDDVVLQNAEYLQSLALGRPPSIRNTYIDCQFPKEEEQPSHVSGDDASIGCQRQPGCPDFKRTDHPPIDYQWKYEFVRDIMSLILEQTVTAEPPTYETILDLDRRVREKFLPAHLNVFMNTEQVCTPSAYMGHCLLGQYRAFGECYTFADGTRSL